MSSESQSATLQAVEVGAIPAAKPRANRLGVIAAFFAIYVIWGSTYLAIRYAVAAIPPLYTAGFRHLIAGTILLLWALAKGLRPTWPQIKASLAIGFLFFLIGHGSLHWAETQISSGLASLLIASEPIWVFLMTCAAEKRWRMNGYLLVGVALGLAGVGLLLGRDVWSSGRGGFLGAIACLIGALSWSAGIIYSRRSHLVGQSAAALRVVAARRLRHAAGERYGPGRISRLFVFQRAAACLAVAGLSHPVRLGDRVHGIQLAAGAFFAHAGGHAHVRKSHRGGAAGLVVRGRTRFVQRDGFGGNGHRGGTFWWTAEWRG